MVVIGPINKCIVHTNISVPLLSLLPRNRTMLTLSYCFPNRVVPIPNKRQHGKFTFGSGKGRDNQQYFIYLPT
jgi:hypothetical protein